MRQFISAIQLFPMDIDSDSDVTDSYVATDQLPCYNLLPTVRLHIIIIIITCNTASEYYVHVRI